MPKVPTVKIVILHNGNMQDVLEGTWDQSIEDGCFVFRLMDYEMDVVEASFALPLSVVQYVRSHMVEVSA